VVRGDRGLSVIRAHPGGVTTSRRTRTAARVGSS